MWLWHGCQNGRRGTRSDSDLTHNFKDELSELTAAVPLAVPFDRAAVLEFCRKYLLLLSDERLQALYRELEAEQPTVERLAAWERKTRQILGKPPLVDSHD